MRKLIPWLVVAALALVASVAFAAGTNPTFTFSTDEPGATFTCQLDNGTATACSSPKSYAGLAPGQHTETIVGTFTVPAPPPPGPTAAFTFTPASPQTGQAVSFDGTASTCGAAPCSYTWADVGPNGTSNWALGTGQTMTFTFSGAGTKYVRLTVKDANARTATVQHNVVVTSGPPPPPLPPPSPGGSCFAAPGSCGYPDPAAGNVGVPAGATLTPSGSITVTQNGAAISGLDVKGSIDVKASNVTIQNTKVEPGGGGCGTASTCGNSDVKVEAGVTGTLIQDSELTNQPGTTIEHAVRNNGDSTTKCLRCYIHSTSEGVGSGVDSGWHDAGTIQDSYVVTARAIPADHVETVYYGGGLGPLVMQHDTLFTVDEGTVFAKADFGNVGTITIKDNLLAGGAWTISTVNGPGGSVVGPITITGNRFARCQGTPTWDGSYYYCQNLGDNGPYVNDGHGYWPQGGHAGILADDNAAVTTWSGNYWDDCGPSQTIPASDNARPNMFPACN